MCSVFGRIFFPLNAWILAGAFQFRSETVPCTFLAGLHFVSEKKGGKNIEACTMNTTRFFFSFFTFLFKKVRHFWREKKKTGKSHLHQSCTKLFPCCLPVFACCLAASLRTLEFLSNLHSLSRCTWLWGSCSSGGCKGRQPHELIILASAET